MASLSLAVALCVVVGGGGCAGKGPQAGGESRGDLDGDPLAMLPGSAVVVANIDARAIFDNGTVGAPLSMLAGRFVPLGDDAGFQAPRDVDRITLASYATGGVDVAAVLRGRFDTARIAAATRTRSGAEIVPGLYAGRTTYTVTSGVSSGASRVIPSVTYCVLSAKTVVAGTGEGLRRLLERLQAGTFERSMAPWAAQTLDTPGAEVAVAADFAEQPVTAAAIGSMRLPWLNGMKVARVLGNFQAPGMNVAATLTYVDASQAQAAADGVRSMGGWLKMLGPVLGGVGLQNLEVTTDAANLQCKFALDNDAVRAALAFAPRLLAPSP